MKKEPFEGPRINITTMNKRGTEFMSNKFWSVNRWTHFETINGAIHIDVIFVPVTTKVRWN